MTRLGLAVVLLAAACTRPASEPPPRIPPGSHDATAKHSFADVEHWQKVFDDPARDTWQKPAELVAALELKPGACVADLGAGTGYLSRYLSGAVGPTGTVLAVEVEPNLVTHLRERAEQEHTDNVVPVLASFDSPRLPPAGVDLILVVDTFHHIDDRIAYFQRARRFLRRGGRVAVVDWEKRELPVGPPPDHKLDRQQVIDEMVAAGYELASSPAVLEYQYVLVFRVR